MWIRCARADGDVHIWSFCGLASLQLYTTFVHTPPGVSFRVFRNLGELDFNDNELLSVTPGVESDAGERSIMLYRVMLVRTLDPARSP